MAGRRRAGQEQKQEKSTDARRSKGEGSVTERKDGRFMVRYTGLDAFGKPKQVCLYAATKREADRLLRDGLADRDAGRAVYTEKMTVAQYLDDWLQNTVKRQRTFHTYRNYEGCVRVHVLPTLGRVRLQKLTASQIEGVLRSMEEEGYAANTVNLVLSCLKAALNQAVRRGYVPRNAAALVAPSKLEPLYMHPLDEEQARAFRKAVDGHPNEALFALTLATGLRMGEVLGLRWQDVDLEKGTLTVCNAVQLRPGSVSVDSQTKSKHTRTIRLGRQSIALLRFHRRAHPAIGGYVFADRAQRRAGQAQLSGKVRAQLRQVLSRAGLPNIRFHDLRHTCATLLLNRGVPVKTVSEMLGHADVTITLQVYAHVLDFSRQAAADAMDAIMEDPQAGKAGDSEG
jgi:integrase